MASVMQGLLPLPNHSFILGISFWYTGTLFKFISQYFMKGCYNIIAVLPAPRRIRTSIPCRSCFVPSSAAAEVDIVQQQPERAERLLQFNDSQCWCARHRKGAHATGQEPEERNAGSKLSRAQKRPPQNKTEKTGAKYIFTPKALYICNSCEKKYHW